MPGPLLHLGAQVLCSHGGMATPSAPNPRVLVSGQPTVVITAPYLIAGCPFNVLVPVPCVTALWVVAATRVFSGGQPLVLMDSQAICVPNGTPLLPLVAQTRVIGS
ncbi:hypothetical protein [Cyanobium sp. ULC084]|nr:MAG: hypothetical protein DCF24_07790 [Cyanobium sp.]